MTTLEDISDVQWYIAGLEGADYTQVIGPKVQVFIQAESVSGKPVESVQSQVVDKLTSEWEVEDIPVEEVRSEVPEETVSAFVLTPPEGTV